MLCVVSEDTERVIGERQHGDAARPRLATRATVRDRGRGARRRAAGTSAGNRAIAAVRAGLPVRRRRRRPRGSRARPGSPAGAPGGAGDARRRRRGRGLAGRRARRRRDRAASTTSTRLADLPTGAWDEPPRAGARRAAAAAGPAARRTGSWSPALNRYRAARRRLPRLRRPGRRPARGRHRRRARAYEAERRRAEALAELDQAKTDVLHQRQPRVPHAADAAARPGRGRARRRRRRRCPPRQRERVEVVQRNGAAAAASSSTRCSTSRGSSPAASTARFEPVDLAPLHRRAGQHVRVGRRAGRPDARRSTARRCPSRSTSTASMWAKIVLNLLSNALKFTFEGGIDGAPARTVDGAAVLDVADTGIGIAAGRAGRACSSGSTGCSARARAPTRAPASAWRWSPSWPACTAASVAVEQRAGRGQHVHRRGAASAPRTCPPTRSSPRAATATGGRPPRRRGLPRRGAALAATGRRTPPVGRGPRRRARRPRVLVVDDNADMRDYVASLLARRLRASRPRADGAAALELGRAPTRPTSSSPT